MLNLPKSKQLLIIDLSWNKLYLLYAIFWYC